MVKADMYMLLKLSVGEECEHMEVNDNDKTTITVKWPYNAESIKNYLTIWALCMFTMSTKSGCVLTSAYYIAAFLLSWLI